MKLSILGESLLNSKLAVPIYNSNGILIVNSGMTLSEKIIKNIMKMNITTVYIHDGNDEITLQETLESPIRFKLIKKLKTEYDSIKKTKRVNEVVVSSIVEEIIGSVNLSENAFLYNNISQIDKDMELANHSIDVTILSIILGINRGYDSKKVLSLGIGALMHDVGKLFTSEENHTEEGYKLLKSNSFFTSTMVIPVIQHHENVDGSGYPDKLIGDKIYEYSKIISICNEYVNSLSAKEDMLPHQILEKITAETGKKFDFDIYKDFIKSIYCYPNGLSVKLNNGKDGVVLMQNKNLPTRPIIMVRNVGENEYINLTEHLSLFVEEVLI